MIRIKRESCILATTYIPNKHKIDGSFASSKLDGMRCLWIPETRGMAFQDILFANTNKDDRKHVATGFWTRYYKPIFAPEWFLDKLPKEHCLDGELFAGYQQFKTVMSTVKDLVPVNYKWKDIGYYLFDIPSYLRLFEPGRINNPNFPEKHITPATLDQLKIDVLNNKWSNPRRFQSNYQYMCKTFGEFEPEQLKGEIGTLNQTQLPFKTSDAVSELEKMLENTLAVQGEGIILRRPHSEWAPYRSPELLKVKRMQDAEGVVVGFTYGLGKLYGLVGSVRLKADFGQGPVEFDLSGFTDTERMIMHTERDEATKYPGLYVNKDVSAFYKIGSKLTFKYRELTEDGKPKEARFWRERSNIG